MKKRGQFFLIAALVIVSLILGLVIVRNVARSTTEDVTLYDLSREFTYEGSQVIDQGIYNLSLKESIYQNTKFLGELYYNSTNDENTELFIIYGDEKVIYYSCTDIGKTCIGSSCTSICTKNVDEDDERIIINKDEPKKIKIRLPYDDSEHIFNIRPGQGFYIIIKKTNPDNTKTIIRNDEVSNPEDIATGGDEAYEDDTQRN